MSGPAAGAPDILAPPPTCRAPRERLPPGTCDAHMHVFGPPERYPLDARRGYTPHVCPLGPYQAMARTLGIDRAVLVQPSVYGTDNAALLDALRAAGPSWRGVVVVAPGIDEPSLASLHRSGVRGVRLNLVNPQVLGIDDAVALGRRIAPLGWHIDLQLDLARTGMAPLSELAGRAPVPLVVDHMGLVDPTAVPAALLDLLRAGRCWVKLSGPYRVSAMPAPHRDLAAVLRALLAANPARLLWGSDWPHTEQAVVMPDAAALAEMLADWVPDAATRRAICVDNPARLYDC